MARTDHAALSFTPHELLIALVAERLDRLGDRMVRGGHSRLAVLGSLEHAEWLHAHVHGMRSFPIVAYVPNPWLDEAHGASFRGARVLTLSDPGLPEIADTILISDDRYEDALREEALRATPPGTIIHRLYERLPIGRERPGRLVVRRVVAGRGEPRAAMATPG
jgi:hypothetical protein